VIQAAILMLMGGFGFFAGVFCFYDFGVFVLWIHPKSMVSSGLAIHGTALLLLLLFEYFLKN
jgi:hypothetical protein